MSSTDPSTIASAPGRDDLIAACELARLRLGLEAFPPMVSRNQYDRIGEQLFEVLDRAPLLSAEDRAALEKGFADEMGQRELSIAINGVMHGKRAMEERFKHLLHVFAHYGLTGWPLATLWLFLAFPDRFVMIEPVGFARLLAEHAPDQALPTAPDWAAYQHSQRLAHSLKANLAARDPVDLVLAQIASPTPPAGDRG
ncbi:hypothetical protein [Wenzhouxiangella marina]|uniref:Uncharacterized protein n=1 Tax=Wenzhouxiangella marina TaxID=1579979 RepID=A0A0K0XS50_9GAMM|nr:hypothetical protein [Wenzhouxiangella marina]AKS40447.1 hypothetical protein WM2015_56 [Wenzhouxiangella marina]MBB6088231.1 hypothetical protein [Wenzhouxiangella marina]